MEKYGGLSIEKVAELFDVSADTIRREIKDGKLKTLPIRGLIRVSRQSIAEYQKTLESKTTKAEQFTNRYV
ncbi:MAG: DNA-binding protein [Proteobacteria bacterium]|nr:DNA-binding protein [Pseudomonadota bacterium]